jgi:hypothetical protein
MTAEADAWFETSPVFRTSALGLTTFHGQVELRPASLNGARNTVEVVFSLAKRSMDVAEKSFIGGDVMEGFVFIVTKARALL